MKRHNFYITWIINKDLDLILPQYVKGNKIPHVDTLSRLWFKAKQREGISNNMEYKKLHWIQTL